MWRDPPLCSLQPNRSPSVHSPPDGYRDRANNDFQNHIGPGAAWIDLNCDGWLDLVVANGTENGAGNVCFLNDGDGTFTDVSEALGVRTGNVANAVVAADVNNDSFADILFANHFATADLVVGPLLSTTLKSRGYLSDLWFPDGGEPEEWDGPRTAGVALGDYNNDGYLDAYFVNQVTAPDVLASNMNGRYFLNSRLIVPDGPGTGFQPTTR